MDPTLAALLGAGIGAMTTVIAAFVTPVMTSRRAHKAHRRELMLEAYANGMRILASSTEIRSVDEFSPVHQQLFEALEHIRLVGTRRAADKFNLLISAARVGVEVFEDQPRSQEVDYVRGILAEAREQFVSHARRDLGIEDPAVKRLLLRFRPNSVEALAQAAEDNVRSRQRG